MGFVKYYNNGLLIGIVLFFIDSKKIHGFKFIVDVTLLLLKAIKDAENC